MNHKINSTKNPSKNCRIARIELNDEIISSRTGIFFFLKFIENTSIIQSLSEILNTVKKNSKGFSVPDIVKQILCFFMEGTHQSISGFDKLKNDPAYHALIETNNEDMCSSHQVKRFFKGIGFRRNYRFREILQKLCIAFMNFKKPDIVYIFMDTMVLDNDDAKKREGVSVTYKKVKGLQSFHLIWNGMIMDMILRNGSAHCNKGDNARKTIENIVNRIRIEYRNDVPIVFLNDSGFFDEELLELMDDLGVFYISAGKFFKDTKEMLVRMPSENFAVFSKSATESWEYCEFTYKCKSWRRSRRALYTSFMSDKTQQLVLSFARDAGVIITNIYEDSPGVSQISDAFSLIQLNHSRGMHELTHRSIKDFISEKLPFKRFESNYAYFSIAMIAFNLYEILKTCYLTEIEGIIPKSYPTTVRRIFIDFPAKIIKTARQLILKINRKTYDFLKLDKVLQCCREPVPL